MIISEVIEICDRLMPNAYTEMDKVRWLMALDQLIYNDVITTHEGAEQFTQPEYTADDMTQELVVSEPYAEDVYVNYLQAKIAQNNGEDVNISECISLARSALIEFPENETLMRGLASVLYNAGYVRHGEHHLSDDEGYDVLDTQKHRTYPEWKEAISLYEKLLKTMEDGAPRHRVIRELTQLYLNTGEYTRALEVIEAVPGIYDSKEFLKAKAADGKERAKAYGEALLKTVRACSELMVSGVIASGSSMSAADKVQSLRGAIGIFSNVCTDGNCGAHHPYIARIDTLLSVYLWSDGKKDEAFEALEDALAQFKSFEEYCAKSTACYSAPLLRLVQGDAADHDANAHISYASLVEDWPWWRVPEEAIVKPQIQADSRWQEWAMKARAYD